MRLFGNLLQRRHRNARPSQGAQIRSLDDMGGHFPWLDLGMALGGSARTEIRNPLAVAVRALKVVEYTVATVGEQNPDDRDADGMALLGLSGALSGLAQHGEWEAVGMLLNALELLVYPHDRPNWLDGIDPYVEPKEGA